MAIGEQERPPPATSSSVVRTQWDSDHVNGKSSVDIVLEWLTTESNYDRWKAGVIPKSQLCEEVLAMMQEQGIQHRTRANIYRKIYSIEASMEGVRALLKGAGLRGFASLDDCLQAGIRRTVLRQCPYYERIGPIMLKKRKRSASSGGQANDNGDGDSTEDEQRGAANGSARAQGQDLDDDFESENGRPVNFVKQEVIPRSDAEAFRRPWDDDCVREKTSMQVLLEWLQTGSKYELWRVFPMHREAYGKQVRAALEAQGIRHRSVENINKKIRYLEVSMKHAKEYLREIGLPGLVTLGLCDRDVKLEILRRCPEFEALAPLMTPPRDQQPEGATQARRKRPRLSTSSPGEGPNAAPPRPTQSEAPNAARSEPSELTNENGHRHELQQLTVPPTSSPNSERQRELPPRLFDAPSAMSDDVKIFDQLELDQRRSRFDQERQRRQIDLDSAREKSKVELARIRIDLEKNEIELVVARAMARQKLLSAGISPAEVDQILPRQRVDAYSNH